MYIGLHPHARETNARVSRTSRRGVGHMQSAVNLPPPQEVGQMRARLDSLPQTPRMLALLERVREREEAASGAVSSR
eukprot:8626815-Pyramimonas_sp.AAC.1